MATEAEVAKRLEEAKQGKRTHFISGWDALEPPFSERYEVEMRTDEKGNRWVDFG